MLSIDLNQTLNAGRIGSISLGDDISQVKRILSELTDESQFWNYSLIEGRPVGPGWYEFQDLEIHFERTDSQEITLTFFVLKPGNAKSRRFSGGGLFEMKNCPIWRGMKLPIFSSSIEKYGRIRDISTSIPDTLVLEVGERGRAIFRGTGRGAKFSQIEIS